MRLYLCSVSEEKVIAYFLGVLFIQSWYINSSLTTGISHFSICVFCACVGCSDSLEICMSWEVSGMLGEAGNTQYLFMLSRG